jgi:hypothetical protein
MCERGYTVTFDGIEGVTIAKEDIIIYRKKKDPRTNLYHLDLLHLYIPEEAFKAEPFTTVHSALGARTVPQD